MLALMVAGNFSLQAAPLDFDKNTVLCDHDFNFKNTLNAKEIQDLFEGSGEWKGKKGKSFLADYIDPTTNKPASQIIAEIAQKYQISSRVLIAKIQTESSSIWHYKNMNQPLYYQGEYMGTLADWLLGFGWTDDGVFPKYKGFYNQVENAAKLLSEAREHPGSFKDIDGKAWSVGESHRVKEKIANNKQILVEIIPKNSATVALYIYTPWLGERDPNATRDDFGNKLLYNVWKMMFGDTGECVPAPPITACPLEGEPKFKQGDGVITTDALKVREDPDIGSAEIKTQPKGTQGKIFEGPACADDYVWWKIEYQDGTIGWSAQDWLEVPQYASKIAYLYGNNIWVINEDGSAKELLLTNASASPVWSPDGKKIAYLRWGPETEIRMANYDGPGDQKVAQVKGSLVAIRWAHDGKGISYLRWPSSDTLGYIDLSTLKEKAIPIEVEPSIPGKYRDYFLGFDIARQAGEIVFEETKSQIIQTTSEGACFRIKKGLVVTDRNGKNKREVFSQEWPEICRELPVLAGRTDPGEYPIFYPVFSPDGQKIAFLDEGKLFTIDADGQNLRELTLASMSEIAWSPDGKKIAFLRSYPQGNEIWIINSDGSGQPRRLVQGTQPSWGFIPTP
jgi:Tol biopolymer transport system component